MYLFKYLKTKLAILKQKIEKRENIQIFYKNFFYIPFTQLNLHEHKKFQFEDHILLY